MTKDFIFGVIGATAVVLLGLASCEIQKNNQMQTAINASFQLENFCSATSVEDFDLRDGVDNGVFFTAAHCVMDKEIGSMFTVSNKTGSYQVQLMAYDKERDVAYLRTLDEAPLGLARLPMDLTPLKVGESVTMYGYPFGFTSKAISTGVVGESLDFGDGIPDLYILTSIAGGFSGGTLVNEDGYFAGIMTGALMGQFETHSGFAFATTPEDIQEFIDAQLAL